MKNRIIVIFTIVTFIIGFMIAVQFQTTNEPERDTRSLFELRQALTTEKERQAELNREIDRQLELLYQLQQTEDVEDVMLDAIEELREQAGLTEMGGPGIIIEVKPIFDESYEGGAIRTVPPYLLRMLLNELNMSGAIEVAVGNERIITTTPIREVNGVTLINGSRMTQFPLTIKVLTNAPEDLHHAVMASQSREFFSYENFNLEVTPINYVKLPPYGNTLRVRYMNPIKEDS
ncbi:MULTISPECIES: DUF881 domain-containing protein [Bacillaceae]|uniref:DUF881 domain-containing protein n=1 Tax=Evansella alkalicola TaxID=745819 RepID=A0ABS6JPE4_9BACI|nr:MULTISPECIES: DUF881 domain-containing protein [Bacillaceae]MBU9720437.1 DUF881 domain-containing protein [Bacillus alkalicola]